MPPRHGGSPGATPGNRTKYSQAERQHAAESPKLSLLRAARRQPAIFRGRGRQVMHLPCKQVYMGALPMDSTISLRGTRLKHRGRSHKPFEAGVIPAPATNFREVIHLPDCKSAVVKQSWKRRTGALPALPSISGLVAQLVERPVVCGRVEGASPFGSAIFTECSSVFRAPGLGPGGRR